MVTVNLALLWQRQVPSSRRERGYYTDLSIWWEKWPLLLRQMPTRDAMLFWALWAIMWEKCPLSLRQLPVHHALSHASECSTAYLSTMNPHRHRQRQQWHKGTQRPHMVHTWWQTRNGLAFKSRLRVYFIFLLFLSFTNFFFLGLDYGYVYRSHKHHDEEWPHWKRSERQLAAGKEWPHQHQRQRQHQQRRRGSCRGRGSRRDTSVTSRVLDMLFFCFFYLIIIIYQTDDAR